MRLKPFAQWEWGARGRAQSRDTPRPKEVVTEEDFSTTSNLGPAPAQPSSRRRQPKQKGRGEKTSLLACEMEGETPARLPHSVGAGSQDHAGKRSESTWKTVKAEACRGVPTLPLVSWR